MKKFLQIIFSFTVVFFICTQAMAVTLSNSKLAQNQTLTSNNLGASSLNNYAFTANKKTSFAEKVTAKILQKKLKKEASSGKAASGGASNTLSLLSCIFGGVGFISVFLGSSGFALLALLLGIAALVLGIMGLKKEDSKAMAIIGIVGGSVVLLLYLIVIVIVAASI